MKKRLLFFVLLSVCLVLASCSAKSIKAPAEIMAEVAALGVETGDVYTPTANAFDDDVLGGLYGDIFEQPTVAQLTDYYVFVDETPLKPQEAGVFVCVSEDAAKALAEFITARVARLAENAKNYQSVDATGINSAEVCVSGCRVGYSMLCTDNSKVFEIIKSGLGA